MSISPRSKDELISISSLGVLELSMYLTLHQSHINSMGIKLEYINELSDLSGVLSMNNSQLLDQIVLLTNNTLINTLLFINRSFKTKTLIELITTSEIYFSPEHSFFKPVFNYVTDKNLLFIVQNKITDIPSSITFILNIIDDETEEIQQKYFTIGKKTVSIDKELISCSDNLFDELAYKFANYFIYSFEDLLKLKQQKPSVELISFFKSLITNFPKIHIITLFFGDLVSKLNDNFTLAIMKEVIDYSDIVIAEKDILQSFYQLYGKKNNDKSHLANCSLEKALLQDANNKKRTDIVKISLLIDKLKTATIIMQEAYSLKELFNATHAINLNTNCNKGSTVDVIINMNYERLAPIFVGGFLSRLLHFKTFNTCLVAGAKVVSKVINNIITNELETVYNKEAYEVIVHISHRNQDVKVKKHLTRKEKGFILDCLNYSESQLKPYNSICDYNCANFLNSKNKLSFLKHQGFIDKRKDLLKDPQLIREPFDKRNNTAHFAKINRLNRMQISPMSMNQTWKEPRMTFTRQRKESPIQLPIMNKTHYSSMRNATTEKNDDRSAMNRTHKSKRKGEHLMEKEKLKEIMMKYEQKASDEIRKCNN